MLKAKVYWNFHRKCFSVQVNGRVVARATHVTLWCPSFRVGKAGRARVLREGRKNVHAYIVGEVVYAWSYGKGPFDDGLAVYNPYEHETFVDKATGRTLTKAWLAQCKVIDGRPSVYWVRGAGPGASMHSGPLDW